MLQKTDFLGVWNITRTIDDRKGRQTGHFSGVATFSEAEQTRLLYDEKGQMRFGQGAQMLATRRYIWDFGDTEVRVSFDDERPFHSFVPNGSGAGTDHPCGDDFYEVSYDFLQWPLWTAVWKVTGPRKDYTSHTVYTVA